LASIIWNKGEKSCIDAWLGGQTGGTPQLIPTAGGNWGLGLGTRTGGVGTTKADTMAQIIEVGTTTANGYARASISRDTNGWPAASLSGSSMASTTAQKTFSFTGAPNPNGATLWFVAGSTTTNADNALFGADTAAVRTFGNGDTERVTATYQQT